LTTVNVERKFRSVKSKPLKAAFVPSDAADTLQQLMVNSPVPRGSGKR
jgi:hypothetical protein